MISVWDRIAKRINIDFPLCAANKWRSLVISEILEPSIHSPKPDVLFCSHYYYSCLEDFSLAPVILKHFLKHPFLLLYLGGKRQNILCHWALNVMKMRHWSVLEETRLFDGTVYTHNIRHTLTSSNMQGSLLHIIPLSDKVILLYLLI